ncbi:hypothetical protein A2422_01625 [Candidatus Woesebacteria bacterium RIFOXYC1_FULL_31_51]|uniref:Uncharacterized protein n=1 Tax=Candidatus Woesebacteria bacterium GW2011_GWC2_31_9 TaxID=1618586 RepID=A0A0F9YJX3_9BACT|nr:MAG: hypothetical protein UR17_C0001G0781 [Candidatus Woesebacteria bacterium GW2011_GWF1_31_35]KKP26948.1 MAG: hypothetical protein UR13_C0001G0043 [Candidatus Woesebacteria bacterium GW2011_GWD1_31_12]KKP27215.1 MAG: hypothetical protein UR16_C0005G0002 [Candidatus Woesebacteria bacterium GW2011_GWB1_31_29]KKP31804.1 MAG: hypothetical protein UR21_C0005G0026 [Candidatus Woesebacteria bacterium GW2011_GWC2_31_9]KKP33900.1 MAG: hypothetical protein UR20_C0006G0003 [Candidatus Woesebacteria b
MNEIEENKLYSQLLIDESKRDRTYFNYTIDALLEGAIIPYAIWPESNQNVAGVISGEIDYDSLPVDESNEFHKGGLFTEQQDIILENNGKEPLCEAQDLKPCLKEECELYNANLGPPVCREFKIAFKKKN